jgi:hypothetical protein
MATLIKDYNDITRIVRNIDLSEKRAQKAMGEKHSHCVELSKVILSHAKKPTKKLSGKAYVEKETERLIEYAKGIVAKDGYKQHDKNIWSAIRNLIHRALAPDVEIEIPAGKDDKGNIIMKKTPLKDIPVTSKSLATQATQVKQALGMTNGRTSNGRKAKRGANQKVQTKGAPQKASAAMKPKDWTSSMEFGFKNTHNSSAIVDAVIAHRDKIARIAKSKGWIITFKPVGEK